MRRIRRSGAVQLALALGTATALMAQGLDMKTGQWRWTVTMTGAPPTMPSSVPPDVAAKILAETRKPHTIEGCVTADDLKNLRLGRPDDEDECTVTSRKVSGPTADFVRTCSGDDPRTETVHMELASRESVRVTVTRSGGKGPSGMTMAGTWIGVACKDDRDAR